MKLMTLTILTYPSCRWCERGYCEDCLDWEKTTLIDDALPEFEMLGFSAIPQAFYIRCPVCHDDLDTHPFQKQHEREYAAAYEKHVNKLDGPGSESQNQGDASLMGSMTEGATRTVSSISTPEGGVATPTTGMKKADTLVDIRMLGSLVKLQQLNKR